MILSKPKHKFYATRLKQTLKISKNKTIEKCRQQKKTKEKITKKKKK